MTAHNPTHRPRHWRGLLVGLLTAAGLTGFGPAAGARVAASTTPAAAAFTWSTLSPPVSPSRLAYASAVYDSDNKTVVLFGGVNADNSLSNDTWVWNGSAWTDYPGSAVQAPPARRLASMAFDPDLHQLILFGGQGADGQTLGDTWAWNGASWYQQSAPLVSRSPSAREAAAMGYDGAGHLLLFGGTGSEGLTPPPASPTTTTGPPPSGSNGSSGPLTALADTWVWSAAGWSPAAGATTGRPPARSGAALALDATTGRAILFGGESTPAASTSPRVLSDLWAWNGRSWGRLASRVNPPARDHAVMVSNGFTHGLVLYSGDAAQGALSDTWLWNGSSWSSVRTLGTSSPRAGAAAAFDASSHQLVVFGGVGPGGAVLGDTLILTSHTPVALGPGIVAAPRPVSRSKPSPTSPSTSHHVPASPPAHVASTTIPVVALPGPASATPPQVATLNQLHRGDLVTLSGRGFSPGAAVTITFHSQTTVVGLATANPQGSFSTTVAIPETAAGGTHHFEATGRSKTGIIAQLIAVVDVVGVPGANPSTSTVQRAVLTAAAFLIPAMTWFGLVGAARWRRRGLPVH